MVKVKDENVISNIINNDLQKATNDPFFNEPFPASGYGDLCRIIITSNNENDKIKLCFRVTEEILSFFNV